MPTAVHGLLRSFVSKI